MFSTNFESRGTVHGASHGMTSHGTRVTARVMVEAKDIMFSKTHIPEAPWFTVEANDKRRARLNCLSHILSKVPYEDMTPEPIKMPKRPKQGGYKRPPFNEQFFVPNHYPYKD